MERRLEVTASYGWKMEKIIEFALLAWEATAGLFSSWRVVGVLCLIILANVGGLVYLGTRAGTTPAKHLQAAPLQVEKIDAKKIEAKQPKPGSEGPAIQAKK